MNTPSSKTRQHWIRKTPIVVCMYSILAVVRYVFDFFRITQADMAMAGIHVGDEGHDGNLFERCDISGNAGLAASDGVTPSCEKETIL